MRFWEIRPHYSFQYGRLNDGELNSNENKKQEAATICQMVLRGIVCVSGWLLVLCFLAAAFIIGCNLALWQLAKERIKADSPIAHSAGQCDIIENNRFDCWPETNGATEGKCLARSCCWQEASQPGTAPSCFFPSNYDGYYATQVIETATGINATLTRSSSTFFSPDVKTLKLSVEYQTDTRLRIKFYDPDNGRYQVPMDVPSGTQNLENPLYSVAIQTQPFNIIVRRKATGAIVFDTTGTAPLIFSDQYLQISTRLSTQYLYGFGEHRNNFLQNITTWRRLVFWTRGDIPRVDNNGYGVQPYYLNLESHGWNANAHGVFLLNSNAGEVALQPFGEEMTGAVTYRFLGGILDFFIVLGPQPVFVVSQFAEVTGLPYFPPFWSLGYHICKYGIKSQADLAALIKRNRDAEMPYDTQWSDIDYMDSWKDFTYDKTNYGNLSAIVQDLHKNQQKFIMIFDPPISSEQPAGTYPAFDDGVDMDIFIKNASGQILLGQMWPGVTAFPDFFHPNAYSYWYKQTSQFHALFQFDGMWIDMNEPKSFIAGSTLGCTNSSLDNPPYTPPTIDGGQLAVSTLCPSAKQALSTHYNLHNMYGWSESKVTRQVLDTIFPNKRSPIISRSTFSGSGKYTGHWLGDNDSNYSDLFFSIPGVLNFNLFGITFSGVDVCGFNGVTTPELCTRWHQLAVFYPFMRNHADISSPYQDPAIFQQPFQGFIRQALLLRYRLLAVLYTALFKAHTEGLPIFRPLFFGYPNAEAIDKQFMWGDQLLVSPVLEMGATSVLAYIPIDLWFDFYNGSRISQTDEYILLDAPIDRINIHLRGGSILPLLPPTLRTDIARLQPFQLLVTPDLLGNAQGELFWDDGDSSDSVSAKKYSYIVFSARYFDKIFHSNATSTGYVPSNGLKLGEAVFYSIDQAPSQVLVNGQTENFRYNISTMVLTVNSINADLLQPVVITWN